MLEPNEGDGAAFAAVEERRVRQAVERLKTRLPAERWTCRTCAYTGEGFRWGIKTGPSKQPAMVKLVICCPGCERPADLSSVGVDPANEV